MSSDTAVFTGEFVCVREGKLASSQLHLACTWGLYPLLLLNDCINKMFDLAVVVGEHLLELASALLSEFFRLALKSLDSLLLCLCILLFALGRFGFAFFVAFVLAVEVDFHSVIHLQPSPCTSRKL